MITIHRYHGQTNNSSTGCIYILSVPETKDRRVYWGGLHLTRCSRILLCKKERRCLRQCIDYGGLNAIKVRYSYPLPLIPPGSFFIKLDLRSAYNLIWIWEGDKWKTAFQTASAQYLVTPYGLTNVPVVFQSFVNKIFKVLLNQYVIMYIDDILIYSKTYKDHVVMGVQC